MKRVRKAKIAPTAKEQLKDERKRVRDRKAEYRRLISRLTDHIEPERLEEFEVRSAMEKLGWDYHIAEDELLLTLIGQNTEMRLLLDWEQVKELADELTLATQAPDWEEEDLEEEAAECEEVPAPKLLNKPEPEATE